MNLGQLREGLRAELRDRSGFAWDDVILKALLVEAHVHTYADLISTGAPTFVHEKAILFPANTWALRLAPAVGESVKKILTLFLMPLAGRPSNENPPYHLRPLHASKYLGWLSSDAWPTVTGDGDVLNNAGMERKAGYFVEAGSLHLVPMRAADSYLFLRYIPGPSPFDTDDDEPWHGELPEYHHLIRLHAAMAATTQTHDDPTFFKARYDLLRETILKEVGISEQQEEHFHSEWTGPEE